MYQRVRSVAGVLLFGGMVLFGWGCGADGGEVVVRDAWARAVPAGQSSTAAYLVIENQMGKGVVLQGVESAVARVVEVHEMAQEGEMMRMRRIETLEIPARGRVALEPGGLHLMLIGLQGFPGEGAEVPMQLHFAGTDPGRATVRVAAVVRGAAGVRRSVAP